MTVTMEDNALCFVRPNPKSYPVLATIQHWQLRDLVVCPRRADEFLYVHGNNVISYDTTMRRGKALLRKLAFAPTSMACAEGYLAAGGQRSQLVVRSLDSDYYAETSVGGSINNALCIARHANGDTRLLVCNNDEKIKVLSLPELSAVESISFPTAVNHAAVSPDGTRMLAVGDTNVVFLYGISNSGAYSRMATLTVSTDAGFSCAWSATSEKFAVASQDGTVAVWDVRSTERLARFTPNVPGNGDGPSSSSASAARSRLMPFAQHNATHIRNAGRCLKFSRAAGVDLLAYTEHVNTVHFIDTRTFQSRQTVHVKGDALRARLSETTDAVGRSDTTTGPGTTDIVSEYGVGLGTTRAGLHGPWISTTHAPGGDASEGDVHITGLAFSPDGTTVFVGTEHAMLAYEVDTISRRRFPAGSII